LTLLITLGVFVSAAALDFASARYQLAFREDRPELAAWWSVVMCLLSAVALRAVVDVSWWMLVPECAGLWCGTKLGWCRARDLTTSRLSTTT
jgi:hypothetical protein